MPRAGFRTVVLDVDSTLCGIEGIDWLASLRGKETAERIRAHTNRAMRGEVALEHVYAERIAAAAPTSAEVAALGDAYLAAMAPGAERSVHEWREAGIRVILVSGGIRPAVLKVAERLGVDPSDVHAVGIEYGDDGSYRGFERTSRLTVATGKRDVIASLNLEGPVLAVGDGTTDLAMRDVVDAFVAYTGFVSRSGVVERADFSAGSFDQLSRIVRGDATG